MPTTPCNVLPVSQRLWRAPVCAVTDEALAGQLRSETCDITSHIRRLADAATEDVEWELKWALVPQVRELRLRRFPRRVPLGVQGRIWLDWRTVWTAADWTAFQAAAEADNAPGWMAGAVTAIAALFGEETGTPPVRVQYTCGCSAEEEDPVIVDPERYTLHRSERGDYLCPTPLCAWAAAACGCGACEPIAIRYVCGFATPCQLADEHPLIVHNILAMFGYLFETPELQSTASRTAYQDVLRPLRMRLKWRV